MASFGKIINMTRKPIKKNDFLHLTAIFLLVSKKQQQLGQVEGLTQLYLPDIDFQ